MTYWQKNALGHAARKGNSTLGSLLPCTNRQLSEGKCSEVYLVFVIALGYAETLAQEKYIVNVKKQKNTIQKQLFVHLLFYC